MNNTKLPYLAQLLDRAEAATDREEVIQLLREVDQIEALEKLYMGAAAKV